MFFVHQIIILRKWFPLITYLHACTDSKAYSWNNVQSTSIVCLRESNFEPSIIYSKKAAIDLTTTFNQTQRQSSWHVTAVASSHRKVFRHFDCRQCRKMCLSDVQCGQEVQNNIQKAAMATLPHTFTCKSSLE